ncbi:MAG: hypothetical protein ACKVVT_09965 [Dehalococcoidia bacterium]
MFKRRWAAGSLVAAALTSVGIFTVTAGAGGAAQVDGIAKFAPAGECTEIAGVFPPLKMEGDLVGCWYTTWLEPTVSTPSGVYQEVGTETFIGCLADGVTCGTFNTTYRFTAKFAPSGAEIHGRCQHPIVSGTGGFAGATGRIDFKDDVVNGCFYYRGHLKIQ